MRGAIPVLLMAVAMPSVAWELPSQNELAAVQGESLQLALCESGIPLPPTRQEARQRAGHHLGLERWAVKKCLVYRTSRAKSERYRLTPENNAATARLARQLGVSDIFCRYLELLAGGGLSRREEYLVNQALQGMLREVYGIDTLQIRLLSESLDLPASQHMQFMMALPVYGMFDLVPDTPPSTGRVMADMQIMAPLMRQMAQVLRTVCDEKTADAAAAELLALLPVWNTTLRTRQALVKQEIKLSTFEQMLMPLLNTAFEQVVQERRRLGAADWFGSACLRSVDELFR